jgi:hypothetical protein
MESYELEILSVKQEDKVTLKGKTLELAEEFNRLETPRKTRVKVNFQPEVDAFKVIMGKVKLPLKPNQDIEYKPAPSSLMPSTLQSHELSLFQTRIPALEGSESEGGSSYEEKDEEDEEDEAAPSGSGKRHQYTFEDKLNAIKLMPPEEDEVIDWCIEAFASINDELIVTSFPKVGFLEQELYQITMLDLHSKLKDVIESILKGCSGMRELLDEDPIEEDKYEEAEVTESRREVLRSDELYE